MGFQAILDEVDQLHGVGVRLEGLAERYSPISEGLIGIAGSVRVATKGTGKEPSEAQ